MACAVVGANESDYHLKGVVPSRDFPLQGDNIVIADVRNAVEGDTYKGKKLLFKRGIEVGQVFKLGSKYSKKLGATFLDENGREHLSLMGCYGIGINRIMASAIELNYDENGICWPINIAPFEVLITVANQNNEEVATAAEEIYNQLRENDVDVLLDDRALRAGVKFKDADLIGIPVRITVGGRSLAQKQVEIKLRSEANARLVEIANVVQETSKLTHQLTP
jgi:prolyl-tRNA synthetase